MKSNCGPQHRHLRSASSLFLVFLTLCCAGCKLAVQTNVSLLLADLGGFSSNATYLVSP